MFNILLISFLSLISLSTQQKDPLKDLCRLFGHATTVVDRNLYIDGGLVNWSPMTASTLNYSSTWFKAGNLDENNGGFPQQAVLTKDINVPSVHGGILWSDPANKIVYQYGGEYGNEMPQDFQLWYYDIIYKTWNISNTSTTDINRASWGAGATVQDKGWGYYYGGWLSNNSIPGYDERTALSTMLVYDMPRNSFRNQTGPDNIPRAEGAMVYVPAGDAGLLVYFGGVQLPFGNATVTGVPMDQIFIYDVGNDKWYTETATGEIPDQRRRFCAGAQWADDRSSYNIYFYGGASIDEGVGFGDVYVLSLPSFKWIKFWPREEDNVGAVFPHHSLTCDVIGSQMIIMGGHFTNSSDCDVPTIYGQHGLNLGQNKEGKWSRFDANATTTYKVPNEIIKVVGGLGTGGAKVLSPDGGFRNRDLKVMFTRAYTPSVREATRAIPGAASTSTPSVTPTPTKSSKTPIIAGTVGGVGGAAVLAGVWFCCVLLHRKKKRATAGPMSERGMQPANHDISRAMSARTQQSAFDTPSVNTHPDDMWPRQYGQGPETPHSALSRSLTQWGHAPATPNTEVSRSLTQRSAPEFSQTPIYPPQFSRSLTQRAPGYAERSEFGYAPPPMPTSHSPHSLEQLYPPPPPPPPALVAHEMAARDTIYEMPATRSPPSFSKPFHAQPEKFGPKKVTSPRVEPYYGPNAPAQFTSRGSPEIVVMGASPPRTGGLSAREEKRGWVGEVGI